jgi:arabinose-5-phosphate isomerase
MTEKKITQLFVIQPDATPVGVIHIHDCLRAGLA